MNMDPTYEFNFPASSWATTLADIRALPETEERP